jgi:hypothetical protein
VSSNSLDKTSSNSLDKTSSNSLDKTSSNSLDKTSSNTLSSEDSLSLRSISVDETPDTEVAPTSFNEVAAPASFSKLVLQHHQDGVQLLSPPDISLTSITSVEADYEVTPGEADYEVEEEEKTTPVVAEVSNGIAEEAAIEVAVSFEAVTKMSTTSSSSGSERGEISFPPKI